MSKIRRVYVAGALNATACDYIQNVHRMIKWAEKVRRLGYSVFVPGIDFLCGLVNGDWDYLDYFNNSQPWLEVADIMFVVPGYEKSAGTKKEIERAESLNIPVYYGYGGLKILWDLIKEYNAKK